jgi:hypothetical protein
MSDLEIFFLILAVIYVWECIGWFPRGYVACLNFWGSTWRLAHPAALMGNQTGGVILANPLPPLGGIFAGAQSPLSISAEGVFGYVAQCVNPGWRPAQSARYFPFDAIKQIDARGRQIRVNGQLLVKSGSPMNARRLAEQLQSLGKLSAGERGAKLREMLRASLDAKAIRKRLENFQSRTELLHSLVNVLFLYVFAALPFVLWRYGLKQSWVELVIGLLGLTTAIAILFNRAHRAFYPDAGEEGFTQTIVVLLSPATAIRARDALSRPLLEQFHPLAVAHALLPVEQYREFARQVMREIEHPCLPVCPSNEPGPQATELAARLALRDALQQFLKKTGIDAVALMKPPKPADETCKSYCPRCGAQFVRHDASCSDCGEMPAVAFPGA